jgi:hypothetical protein
VLAGGVALVGTPVQARAGIQDSPERAYRDWMAWTVDADPAWTRFYVENSRELIFDESSRSAFGVRGAAWLNNPGDGHPILDNPKAAKKAGSLEELAALTALPAGALAESVRRFNASIAAGVDAEFGRFGTGDEPPPPIAQPPFYAVQMFR